MFIVPSLVRGVGLGELLLSVLWVSVVWGCSGNVSIDILTFRFSEFDVILGELTLSILGGTFGSSDKVSIDILTFWFSELDGI